MSTTDTLIVIPARWGSTRFPGKSLASLAGKPLVQWVWEAVSNCRLANGAVIATDDERIAEAAAKFGGDVEMTGGEHRSGTDRMAEVAEHRPASLYVNVQGDEPLLKAEAVDSLIEGMTGAAAPIGTLAHRVESLDEYRSPDVVKVVTGTNGNALYFSRSPLPHFRDGIDEHDLRQIWRHVGIYAFRAEALRKFVSLKPSSLETLEALEQLRALENGMDIRVFPTHHRAIGVDTPADLEAAEQLIADQNEAER